MAEETKIEAHAAVQAPAKVAEAVAQTVETIARESAKTAKRTRAAIVRKGKRQAKRKTATAKVATPKVATGKVATRRTVRKTRKSVRKISTAARRSAAAATKGIESVTANAFFKGFDFAGFDAMPSFGPSFAPFQNMFAQANEQSQGLAQRSQKVASELTDLARANVEAVVEAGRVAAEGARSVAQDAATTGRSGFEQAADAIRSLAEAKSPTEYLQLQSDFARASFDRMVTESSKLTESMVKLAGEAFQPLSNRASANAERFNTLVA
ncbi:MAG: TIGR01841 family phasin [Sphingomicrobium sp.]